MTDCLADVVGGAGCGLAEQVLELGEDLFDRVEVGGVFRQQDQLGAGGAK